MHGNKIWGKKPAAHETPQDHKTGRTEMCRNGTKPLGKRKVRYLLLKWITWVDCSPHLTLQLVSVEAEDPTVFFHHYFGKKKKSLKNWRFPFPVTQIKRKTFETTFKQFCIDSFQIFSNLSKKRNNDSALEQEAVNKAITEVTKKNTEEGWEKNMYGLT